MADSFGVGSYMPGRIYAPWAQPALVTATCVARDIPMERSLTSTEAKNEKLAITVSIPSVSQLRVVPWGELLKIRNDLGRGYFASIKAWHEEPDKYAGEVERCLQAYAKALTSAVKTNAPLATVALHKFSDTDKVSIRSATQLVLDAISEGNPVAKLFISAVGPLSNIAYSWLSERNINLEFAHSRYKSVVI